MVVHVFIHHPMTEAMEKHHHAPCIYDIKKPNSSFGGKKKEATLHQHKGGKKPKKKWHCLPAWHQI